MTRSVFRAARRAAHRAGSLRAAALVAALLLASPASGQSSSTLGIYAGGTSSDFHGNDTSAPTHLGGFVAGIRADWSLAAHWSVQPGLEFIQKGSSQTDYVGGSVTPVDIRMSYVEIPVLLRAAASEMGGFTPWIAAGPHVAFKAACSLDATVGTTHYTSCSQLVATGNTPTQPATTESVDYGVTAGAGVDFKLGGEVFTISARYDQGFANVFSGQDIKNRALVFQLGYRIR